MRNRGLPTRQDFRDHGAEQHAKIDPKTLASCCPPFSRLASVFLAEGTPRSRRFIIRRDASQSGVFLILWRARPRRRA